MSSKPSSSSSSSSAKPPTSSSSAPKPSSSSSSSSRPSGSSSSPSSSAAAKPSSSSGSSGSSAPPGPPPQPTPYISANAWMSFFLFCCLVLVILQGPLGLTGSGPASFTWMPSFAGAAMPAVGGGLGCGGMVAAQIPWCTPIMASPAPVQYIDVASPMVAQAYQQRPQMGGQGQIATPGGGAGWSWYANNQHPSPENYGRYAAAAPPWYRSVQYQRPGLQVSVESGSVPLAYGVGGPPPREYVYQEQHAGPPPAPLAQAPQPVIAPPIGLPATATQGLQNLENAFYPLLVGAIALLVIFDYAS